MDCDEKYLKLLAARYPNKRLATSEIINLNAIARLPKGTEYFFSDIHGEYEAFLHLLRSASGIIREKISIIFEDSMLESEQLELANLVFYPKEVLDKQSTRDLAIMEWEKITIFRLVKLCKELSSKYTRSKVRKKLPPDYAYALEELLNVDNSDPDKIIYYNEIIYSIIEANAGKDFILALCILVQRLAVDKLHIIGDIFDRGPRADIIMNELLDFPDVDIQWGNHDISWMGAACGNLACIANVVRIAVKYNNFDLLEDGYGINLRPLSTFAALEYEKDPCTYFMPKQLDKNKYDNVDMPLAAKMHKAMTIMQFKIEGQIMKEHPEYNMGHCVSLEHVDFEKGEVRVDGKVYPIRDGMFPTIDTKNPLQLTAGEKDLLNALATSFQHSELLHRHIRFLYAKGSMYTCCNSNLLYHACIPMEENGEFTNVMLEGKAYAGKALLDYINKKVKDAYFLPKNHSEKKSAVDFMWYLWCGENSPLFGKSKMATFESYFIEEKEAKKEYYNPYFYLSQNVEICDKILKEFHLDIQHSHIINGHVPVRIKDGESPVRAEGKLYVIDGGIAKSYQSTTGIAGYTMIYNSHHIALAEHHAKLDEPTIKITEVMPKRVMVADTDIGKQIAENIKDLKMLVEAYEDGRI